MKRTLSLASVLILSVAAACAGGTGSCVLIPPSLPDVHLTGNALIDFAGQRQLAFHPQEGVADASASSRKSPWLAAGLSAVLPGAGEFYAESYWKTAAFIGAEVALWVFAYVYDRKGNRQTDYFQNYANAHWSVVQYAHYAQDHYAPQAGDYSGLFIPNTSGLPPWQQVNWSVLNRMEQDIGATDAGSYYSHILPPWNQQQYYELIGKYPQFNQGWDDAGPSFNFADALTPRFQYYAGQRGLANTYYTTASTFVGIAVVNHVVSAIDAALTAGSYNRGLHASVGSLGVPAGSGYVTVPALQLQYGL